MALRRHSVMTSSQVNPELVHQFWALTDGELRRAQDHALMLSKTALERLATFLLEMFERATPEQSLQLPMPRMDIADHLGLTIETVSRLLGQLEAASVISIPACKRIVLRDRAALRHMAG
jgi:CRP/FNR family nitrogen fixation transcriptional regulator